MKIIGLSLTSMCVTNRATTLHSAGLLRKSGIRINNPVILQFNTIISLQAGFNKYQMLSETKIKSNQKVSGACIAIAM
jgi:hypothetical protein